MMKHIAKHTLLFGAFAMLLSTMPMQAMETAPAEVRQEVTTKQGFFGRWTERAKNLRMKNLIKELNRAWNPFIKCVEKGDENCSQRAKVVRNIITSILALVAITGVTAAGVAIQRRLGRGAPRVPADTPFIKKVKIYLNPHHKDKIGALNKLESELFRSPSNLTKEELQQARELWDESHIAKDRLYNEIITLLVPLGVPEEY